MDETILSKAPKSKMPKQKGFLLPLKSKTECHQATTNEHSKPKIPSADKKESKDKNNVGSNEPKETKPKKKKNVLVIANKQEENQDEKTPKAEMKEKKPKKAPKQEKKEKMPKSEKIEKTAPVSLSDQQYADLFQAVLENSTARDSPDADDDADKKCEKEDKGKDVPIVEKCSFDDDNDLDSIKSDDVDSWADNSAKGTNNNHPTIPQPVSLKPSKFLKKKAERSGILKPKQLIFPHNKVPDKMEENAKANKNSNKDDDSKKDSVLPNKKECVKNDSKPKEKKKTNKGKEKKESHVKKSSLLDNDEEADNSNSDEEETDSKPKEKKKTNKGKEKKESHVKKSSLLDKDEEADDCNSDEETGTWIQCSKKDCNKWRYVDGIQDPVLVPSDWECKMNSDKDHNLCDAPEVDYDESEHICTPFTIGSLVWAKMDGYPWWPGLIEPDPDFDIYFELLTEKSMVPFQYHVTFFDDSVSRAWVRTNLISPYVRDSAPENKAAKNRSAYKKEIQQAVKNANTALELSLKDRVNKFGFSKRFSKKTKWHTQGLKAKRPKTKSAKKGRKKKSPGVDGNNESVTRYAFSEPSDDDDDLSMEFSEYLPVNTKSRGRDSSHTPNHKADNDVAPKTDKNKCDSLITPAKQLKSSNDTTDDDSDSSSDDDDCVRQDKVSDGDGKQSVEKPKLDSDVFTMELGADHSSNHDTAKTDARTGDTTTDRPDNVTNTKQAEDNKHKGEGQLEKKKKSKALKEAKSDDQPEKVNPNSSKKVKGKLKVTMTSCDNDDDELKATDVISSKEENSTYVKDGMQKKKQADPSNEYSVRDNTVKDKKTKPKKQHKKSDLEVDKSINNEDVECDKIDIDAREETSKGKKEKLSDEARHKSEDDSDKENRNPNDQHKDNKNEKKKTKKSPEKRPISVVDKSNDAGSKQETKKLKFKLPELPVANTDSEKTCSNSETSVKKKKEVNLKSTDKKTSKKMSKGFALPAVSTSKSIDRQVPEISSSTKVQDDNICSTKEKEPKISSNKSEDQRMVPDITMSSDNDHALSDVEMELVNKATIKKQPRGKLSLNRVTPDESESDEEMELDLDLGPSVSSNINEKLARDSELSDSDNSEQLDLDVDMSKSVTEDLTSKSHIFGRFAGSCADHGSDSDPYDIED